MPEIYVAAFWLPKEGGEISKPFLTRTNAKGLETMLYGKDGIELGRIDYENEPDRDDVIGAIEEYAEKDELVLSVAHILDTKARIGKQLRRGLSPLDFDYFAGGEYLEAINNSLKTLGAELLEIDDPVKKVESVFMNVVSPDDVQNMVSVAPYYKQLAGIDKAKYAEVNKLLERALRNLFDEDLGSPSDTRFKATKAGYRYLKGALGFNPGEVGVEDLEEVMNSRSTGDTTAMMPSIGKPQAAQEGEVDIQEFRRIGNKLKDVRYKQQLEDVIRDYRSALKRYREGNEGPLPEKITKAGDAIKKRKFSLGAELQRDLGSMGIDW